jgi:NADH-quinone oxidoreductase subunit L
LFLAAGSVIIALHHEQDMRKMGGLAALLPVTYVTFLIGSLALSAIPPFAGFYSKDIIIDAVRLSTLPGATYAYYCVLAGAFVTPLYTFRALFLTFHTTNRTDPKLRSHIHESPLVITIPLVLLAIPSLIAGQILIDPMLFSHSKLLGDTIFVLPAHNTLSSLAAEYRGPLNMALTAGLTLTFWLALAGIVTAWLFIAMMPSWSEWLKKRFSLVYAILLRKYGFDDFNQIVLVRGTRDTGLLFYDVSDVKVIDGVMVNGSGRLVQWFARVARKVQTGYIYHYALAMVVGIVIFLVWFNKWGF